MTKSKIYFTYPSTATIDKIKAEGYEIVEIIKSETGKILTINCMVDINEWDKRQGSWFQND